MKLSQLIYDLAKMLVLYGDIDCHVLQNKLDYGGMPTLEMDKIRYVEYDGDPKRIVIR